MTSLLTSRAWSEPIVVAAGDILQNTGNRSILVCAEATADADDSLMIRPRSWFICLATMTIRVATHGIGIGRVTLGRGLGEDDGVDAPEPVAPAAFAPHQWGVSTGTEAGTVSLEISGRPSNGGSALTAFEYTNEEGEPETGSSLEGLGTGVRVLSMPEDSTEYPFRIRAVNTVGPGPWSETKTATSGATAELPTIEIDSISPDPLVAGQEGTVTFSVALTQAPTGNVAFSGSGTTWTFTTPIDDTLNVSGAATKEGYTSLPFVFDVQPAAPQLVEQDGELVLLNVTTNTPPFTLPPITEPAEYAGTYQINPADFISGPIWLVDTEATQDGDTLTLLPGLPGWLAGMEPVNRAIQWLRGETLQAAEPIPGAEATTYQINTETDAGLTIWPSEITIDKDGNEVVSIGEGIAVAPGQQTLPPDTFSVANQVGINGKTFESGETWVSQVSGVQAEVLDGWLEGYAGGRGSFIRGAATRGSSQYATASQRRNASTGSYRGIFIGVCLQQGAASGYILHFHSGAINLTRVDAGTLTILATVPYPSGIVGGSVAKVELARKPGGILEGYINDALLLTATDTTYTDGGIGAISLDPTGNRHSLDNFEARATR